MGYQCSNYYRQLIREGVIIDDNYYVDQNNRLAFKFKTRSASVSTKKRKASKKPKEFRDLDDLDVDSFDYSQLEEKNCLPVFLFVGSLILGVYRCLHDGGSREARDFSVWACFGL